MLYGIICIRTSSLSIIILSWAFAFFPASLPHTMSRNILLAHMQIVHSAFINDIWNKWKHTIFKPIHTDILQVKTCIIILREKKKRFQWQHLAQFHVQCRMKVTVNERVFLLAFCRSLRLNYIILYDFTRFW